MRNIPKDIFHKLPATIAKSRGNNSQQISDFAANTDTIFFQDFLEAKLSDLFRGLGSIPGTNVIKIPR
jgi:hypothetical protein